MEPQYQPPSKTARLSYHVTHRMRSEDYGSEMRNKGSITSGSAEGPDPAGHGLRLGLGLGLGLSRGVSVHEHGGPKPSSAFTFLQMRELEHQALIYKYIEAGVAVPNHLILPVWNSVSSLRRLNGGLHEHYNPTLFEYKSTGEAEPSRCRRTDGKKWRCGKDVVPNEKYCERHIHRGRHRSKKRVEPPQLSTTATSINLSIVPPPSFLQ